MIWAVHITDSVLTMPWWVGGWLLAGALAVVGAWRIREEEIPQVSLLTAAFFITSAIHIGIPLTPTSFHLLLNGLMGVALGRRAALAIPLAVFLQFLMLGHGGLTTVGVNSCVMLVPALIAGWAFRVVRRSGWYRRASLRYVVVAVCVFLWSIGICFSVSLLATKIVGDSSDWSQSYHWGLPLFDPSPYASPANQQAIPAVLITFNAVTLIGLACVSAGLAFALLRFHRAADFSLGLVIGGGAVVGSIALNCLVLIAGGEQDWTYPAFIAVVVHLPLAALEGVILGFAVCFLEKVKPEMLDASPGG